MVAGSKDEELDPKHRGEDQPSPIWPEGQDMVTQQSAANEMFRQNSEKLNTSRAQEASQEKPAPENRHHGSTNDLKQEHAEAVNREAKEPERNVGERELHFVKDGPRPNRAALKEEHAEAAREGAPEGGQRQQETGERELKFVKDKDREQEPARDAPSKPENTLHFVKDRNRGPDIGR